MMRTARVTDNFDGGSRRKPPKEVSLTDPQAAWVDKEEH